ncbi:MAG: hypothetical protein AAF430_22150 [Myxococcota bacterium]
MERRNRGKATRTAGWLGAMGVVAGLAMATPAQAGDEFEDGFKTALGAIAAHEVVGGGKFLLQQILLGPGHGYAGPYRGHGYGHRGYRQRGYVHHPPYQPVNIHKVRKEYHYYDGDPYDRPPRGRRHGYERYERYEKSYDDGYRHRGHRHSRYRDRYYDDDCYDD